MVSRSVKELLEYIEKGKPPEEETPIRTLNAFGSYPLAYRSFGGQAQGSGKLDDTVIESAFGSHYLLTMLASGSIIRHMLYREQESCHSLYCDNICYAYLDRHGMVEHGVWDRIDHQILDGNITMENVDHRIYYSAVKPYALIGEANAAAKDNLPILFVDTDLILKRRHEAFLENPGSIRAAYGHLEAIDTPCYPDFTSLHFPDGYHLPEGIRTDLPAINTCLLYFNDRELLIEWCHFFKELFLNNHLPYEPDEDRVLKQLLGADQRTFPMIAAEHGYWNTKQLDSFLNIIWDPPFFYNIKTGQKEEWHYYTLEYHPEHPGWLQDITHIWINKRNIERDIRYRNYQGCMMLEIILELEPGIEPYLRSFSSLKPYFDLYRDYGTIEQMLLMGAVSNKLDKSC